MDQTTVWTVQEELTIMRRGWIIMAFICEESEEVYRREWTPVPTMIPRFPGGSLLQEFPWNSRSRRLLFGISGFDEGQERGSSSRSKETRLEIDYNQTLCVGSWLHQVHSYSSLGVHNSRCSPAASTGRPDHGWIHGW
jgi:hypothetical protein